MAAGIGKKGVKNFILILGGFLLAADAFGLDLLMPLDMAIGVPYALVVVLGLWWPGRAYIYTAAVAGSLLCLLGYYFSYKGVAVDKAVINRGLALFVIWMVAALCLFHKRAQSRKLDLQRMISQIGLVCSHPLDSPREFPLFKHILDTLLVFTQSRFGVIEEVLETGEGRPYLEKRAGAVNRSVWKEPAGLVSEEPAVASDIELYSMRHLLDQVLNTGKPLIVNYSPGDAEGVSSFGQPALESFLGLPVYHDGKLICVAAIANRIAGYDGGLADSLKPLVAACASRIYLFQVRREQERAEQRLVENQNRMREIEENLGHLKIAIEEKDERLAQLTGELKQAGDILGEKEKAIATLAEEKTRGLEDVESLKENLFRLQEELSVTASVLSDKDAHIAKVEGERNRAEGSLWDSEEKLAQARKALEQLEQGRQETVDRANKADADLEQAASELSQHSARIAEMESRLRQAQDELRDKTKLAAQIEDELLQAERASREKNAELAQIASDKEETQRELRETQTRLANAEQQLQSREQVLSDREAQIDRMELQAGQVQETLRKNEDMLSQIENERVRLEQVLLQQEEHIGIILNEAREAGAELKRREERLMRIEQDLSRARQALHASESRFSEVVRNLEEWVWEVDATGRFTYSNAAVEKMLGYRADALVRHKYFYDLFVPESREELKAAVFRVFEQREVLRRGVRLHQRQDGRRMKIESSAVPILDDGGHLSGYRGVSREIAPLAGLGKPQPRSEEKKEFFLDKDGQGICGLDALGNTTYINAAGAKMLGFTAEELVGKNQHATLHHSRADGTPYRQEECPIQRALTEGRVSHVMDEVFWRKDGTAVAVEYICTPIWEKNRQAGAVVTFTYVPPWKTAQGEAGPVRRENKSEKNEPEKTEAAENSPRQEGGGEKAEKLFQHYARELERSNQELRDFASIASHDLQEPLRKIMGFSSRLKKDCAGSLDARGKDYLERLERSTRQMQQFIDDLLQYSRVTAKPPLPQRVDLNEVVADVLSLLEGRIERTGARVQVDPLPTIFADRVQMRQLFQNLVANALKFHKAGEPPVVSLRHRPLENHRHEIRVEDQGVGFNEQHLERIFQPFERLHGRSEFEGTGMGLAICRKIVERHGGVLTATSIPQKGATFIITLPEKQDSRGASLSDDKKNNPW